MQAAGEDFWLLDNGPPSLPDGIPQGDNLGCNSNGFKGPLYKVPKLTGRTQPLALGCHT